MASAKHPVVYEGPIVEGKILDEATLTAEQMAYMNFAREEYRSLERLLLRVVLPALGEYDQPVLNDVRRHLEQIASFSGNFCWKHRHLGEMNDAKDVSRCGRAD